MSFFDTSSWVISNISLLWEILRDVDVVGRFKQTLQRFNFHVFSEKESCMLDSVCEFWEREKASMCIKGGFSSENIPQFHAPRWVTGWLSWESTSEGLIGRTGFGEHKRYLIPSVEWGSALIWVLISSTYSIEECTETMLCLRYVPSYIKIAIYFALWFKCSGTVLWACGSADKFVCICSREHIICVSVVSKSMSEMGTGECLCGQNEQ